MRLRQILNALKNKEPSKQHLLVLNFSIKTELRNFSSSFSSDEGFKSTVENVDRVVHFIEKCPPLASLFAKHVKYFCAESKN